MCSNCTGEYEGRVHGLPTRGSHDYSSRWLDVMVERRDNALEAMLREKLQAKGDLLDAALQEQWVRDRYKLLPLVIA